MIYLVSQTPYLIADSTTGSPQTTHFKDILPLLLTLIQTHFCFFSLFPSLFFILK